MLSYGFDKLSLKHPLVVEEELTVVLNLFFRWSNILDYEGLVIDPNALKKRIFYGKVEYSFRKERGGIFSQLKHQKNQWQYFSPEKAKRFTKFGERKGLIKKDVDSDLLSLTLMERSTPKYNCDRKRHALSKGDVAVSHENLIASVAVGSLEINFYPFDVFGNFYWDLIHTVQHMQRGGILSQLKHQST
uniref:Uncharacterized protein n=1 Tax=Lactuca sativa TaxID=4236 RepID=A0A9R1VHZ6_LACSA|nr:hypothetical protein LSAT_V11C500293270 [Lactuca sativa]